VGTHVWTLCVAYFASKGDEEEFIEKLTAYS
jgi:hypothetical protein